MSKRTHEPFALDDALKAECFQQELGFKINLANEQVHEERMRELGMEVEASVNHIGHFSVKAMFRDGGTRYEIVLRNAEAHGAFLMWTLNAYYEYDKRPYIKNIPRGQTRDCVRGDLWRIILRALVQDRALEAKYREEHGI